MCGSVGMNAHATKKETRMNAASSFQAASAVF